MFPLTRVPFWNSGFLSHSHVFCDLPPVLYLKKSGGLTSRETFLVGPGAWPGGPGQARETGICPVREELYSQCFDELIRQAGGCGCQKPFWDPILVGRCIRHPF